MVEIKNVLSYYDGMSCGQIALNKLGIKYENYYASEIDKFAISVTKHNYPDTIHIGDVRNVNLSELPKINLLIGGSPCTNLSFQNSINDGNLVGLIGKSYEEYVNMKQNNIQFHGVSYLFWEYVHALKTLKPDYFLLENVMMPKEWKDIITKELGVEPILINSSRFSAQNRKRLYWTNIPIGDINEQNCDLVIKDILEENVDKKYYISKLGVIGNIKSKFIDRQPMNIFNKSNTCKVGGNKKNIVYKHIELFDGIEKIISDITYNEMGARNLTPIEYERLQTVPDNYTSIVSDTQRYKMLGNGWNINTICWLFGGLIKNIKHTNNELSLW